MSKPSSLQPVTKTLIISTVALALVISLCDLKYLFILEYNPFISQWSQYYRFLLIQFVFKNESQVLLSIMIFLKAINKVELIFGSAKFVSILIVSFIYVMIIDYVLLFSLYRGLGINFEISSGPISLIMLNISFFNDFVPSNYRFAIKLTNTQLVLNDKFFILVTCILFLLNEGLNSLVPGVIGWLLGKLIMKETLLGKNWMLLLLKNYLINREFSTKKIISTSFSGRTANNNNNIVDLEDQNAPGGYDNDNDNYDDDDDDEAGNINNDTGVADTPVRPLGSQLLDTFRT